MKKAVILMTTLALAPLVGHAENPDVNDPIYTGGRLPFEERKAQRNMVHFRGGYARNSAVKGDDESSGLVTNVGAPDRDGLYLGSGVDFSFAPNFWGVLQGTPLNNTEMLAELLFEYRNFKERNTAVTPALSMIGGSESVNDSEFIVSAAPKIKFRDGRSFRPWIIPVGFAMHINTPSGTSHMTPGVVFGGGGDYRVWRNLFVGADARYHVKTSDDSQVPDDGFSAGGYIGFGF